MVAISVSAGMSGRTNEAKRFRVTSSDVARKRPRLWVTSLASSSLCLSNSPCKPVSRSRLACKRANSSARNRENTPTVTSNPATNTAAARSMAFEDWGFSSSDTLLPSVRVGPL